MFSSMKQGIKILNKICTRKICFMSSDVKISRININRRIMRKMNTSTSSPLTLPGTAWNSNFLLSQEKFDDFMDYFPSIVDDLTEKDDRIVIPEVRARYEEVLRYVVPFGKRLRAFITMAAYELLEKPENLTAKNIELAKIMGWILETFQGALVIFDDIMDEGQKRRGGVAWHRRENIGLHACNDAFLIEQGVYTLLKKHFSDHHCYIPAMRLFHSVLFKTVMGETYDTTNTTDGKPDLETFNMDRFHRVAEYKTGFYTFHLPISLAMYMANLYDPEEHERVKELSRKFTFLYQIQDDFMDCFGDSSKSGKKGTDVEEGKCTWMAVTALEKANLSQRKIMEEYFGRQNPEAAGVILNLFEEMNLGSLYDTCVKNIYASIQEDVKTNIKNEQLKKVYYKIMKALDERMC